VQIVETKHMGIGDGFWQPLESRNNEIIRVRCYCRE
jgi:hypothetical protein